MLSNTTYANCANVPTPNICRLASGTFYVLETLLYISNITLWGSHHVRVYRYTGVVSVFPKVKICVLIFTFEYLKVVCYCVSASEGVFTSCCRK